MDPLEELKKVTVYPDREDGGLGANVAWAVAEIERLREKLDRLKPLDVARPDFTIDTPANDEDNKRGVAGESI